LWENWAISDITDITVSSEQLQFPKTFLRDPLRSKRWRTQLGWNINGELNENLDFTEGTSGAAVAVIPSGNYATGALLATAITAAMNAAATDNTYLVTYDGVTNKFTIARATGVDTIDLNWSTGPNAAFSIGLDIGFDVSSDDTGLTSYLADSASFGSRSWVKFDFSAGTPRDVRALIAFDGNFIASTIITVEANATDAWGAPSFSVTLALDSAANDFIKAIAFIDTTTLRYWRIVINDPGNSDGFTEMGVPYLGDYQEPSNGYAAAFTDDRIELTAVAFAEEGANFQHVRNTAWRNALNWLGIPTAEKPRFDEMAKLVKVGRPFFMALEPLIDIQKTRYVMLEKPMKDVFMAPSHWRFNTDLREVLG
jgi:hypothetical protein